MGQRREPRLFRVVGLSSPCLVGLFRPAVLLPQEMPAEALSWALAHELTHWRRRDLWYQLLQLQVRLEEERRYPLASKVCLT